MAAALPHDELLNTLVRMVVPMRREFGHPLDVAQFMRDPAYAAEILALAARSQDARLRDYVRHVQHSLHSPPLAATPAPSPMKAPALPADPEGHAPSGYPSGFSHSQLYGDDGHKLSAEELRDKVKKKYTGGLR
jgi:hypothetical protein